MVAHYPALNRPDGPLVSVCIAHYRGPELIAACLDSVLEQQCDFSFEIIVHDDASPDDSVAFLREKYPQVELLASRENIGFCVANNRMVNHAKGDYILLLNNDATLFPDALETLMRKAKSDEGIGILTLPQYDWESGTLVDRGCLIDPFYNPVPNLDANRTDVAMVIGACLWIRRSTWYQLGGFPDWFQSIAEDMLLCCLARRSGWRVCALTKSGYLHHQGHSFGGNKPNNRTLRPSLNRRRLSERNKTYAMLIATPGRILWVLFPLHIVLLTLEGLTVSILTQRLEIFFNVYLASIWSIKRNIKNICEARASANSSKSINSASYFSAFTYSPQKVKLLLKFGVPKFEQGM